MNSHPDPGVALGPSSARSRVLARRIRIVVAATIAYNAVEAVIALSAGAIASSSALVGFGLDSIVEVLSAAAVAWQFSARDPQRRERFALRLIAVSFFGLAVFVTTDALRALLTASPADESGIGIALALVSLIVMPTVSWIERRAGRELGSATAVADSKQTLVCAYLSAALLIGLVLNAAFGWWWADPLAALVIAGFAIREGIEAWRGDGCCATSGALLRGETEEAPCDDGCACNASRMRKVGDRGAVTTGDDCC